MRRAASTVSAAYAETLVAFAARRGVERDALRRKMALHYLNGGEATVNETAALLGFSEASAFKRWTGVSPRNHRP